MIGNLKMYQGAARPQRLRRVPARARSYPLLPRTLFLWIIRGGLIAAFVLHIHAAWSLTRMNQRAKAGGYATPARLPGGQLRQPVDALDRRHHPALPRLPPRRPHLGLRRTRTSSAATSTATSQASLTNVVPVAVIYIVANIALGIHLFHGAWSMFQSLGLNNPKYNAWRRNFAIGFAALITSAT